MSRGTNKTLVRLRSPQDGFTIVELLTVMSIIIILMSILVPALSRVRRYAKVVTQKGQFADLSKGLELFRNDHSEQYPDSGPTSATAAAPLTPSGYCGAMRLCEAVIGQDGMGFNPSSQFTTDGIVNTTGEPCDLYPFNLCNSIDPSVYSGPTATRPDLVTNLQQRIKYVDVENIKPIRLQDMFTWDITTKGISWYSATAFTTAAKANGDRIHNAVIGDVFLRSDLKSAWCSARAGQKAGMPVLYYKADPSKLVHDVNVIPLGSNTNIYNFDDNYAITALGCPWEQAYTTEHPMKVDPRLFYKETLNTKITSTPRPHNEDQYILMSAGWDGLYGTKDDVFNFTE